MTHFVKQSACKELNPDKPEITSYKHQIPNLNVQLPDKIKRQLFGILNFGHCDLFDIYDLSFGFFISETRTLAPETLRFLQHVVRKNGLRVLNSDV